MRIQQLLITSDFDKEDLTPVDHAIPALSVEEQL